MAALEELSYGLAVRALEQQEATLTEVRARTGTLLTASSLVASFLGAAAIDQGGVDGFVAAALMAFGASVLMSLYVLLPKDGLVFALDAPAVFEELFPFRADGDDVHRRLAYWAAVLP